ncbi:MAG: hypothetical protein Q9162_003939 [Coniocarpon cinnabarinum]
MDDSAGSGVSAREDEMLRSAFDFTRGWTEQDRARKVREFLERSQLYEFADLFSRGARLAQGPRSFEDEAEWTTREEGKPCFGPRYEILRFEKEELRRELDTYSTSAQRSGASKGGRDGTWANFQYSLQEYFYQRWDGTKQPSMEPNSFINVILTLGTALGFSVY